MVARDAPIVAIRLIHITRGVLKLGTTPELLTPFRTASPVVIEPSRFGSVSDNSVTFTRIYNRSEVPFSPVPALTGSSVRDKTTWGRLES